MQADAHYEAARAQHRRAPPVRYVVAFTVAPFAAMAVVSYPAVAAVMAVVAMVVVASRGRPGDD
ncbi:hypothetical protein [Haloglomus litoreum]|uniref:hypothetical protein n=1 Tax=Haloglomus litoreum TaxID=3034026 RepID=UPI0023E76DE3|nr:hypothetical protein [Haloglomus sp. DT116]